MHTIWRTRLNSHYVKNWPGPKQVGDYAKLLSETSVTFWIVEPTADVRSRRWVPANSSYSFFSLIGCVHSVTLAWRVCFMGLVVFTWRVHQVGMSTGYTHYPTGMLTRWLFGWNVCLHVKNLLKGVFTGWVFLFTRKSYVHRVGFLLDVCLHVKGVFPGCFFFTA